MPALAGLKAKLRAMLYDASAAQRIEDKIAPITLKIDEYNRNPSTKNMMK